MSVKDNLNKILKNLPNDVQLVAVSKTKPNSDIIEAYNAGQRVFGENKALELARKHDELPKDIIWHMIGHLQTNKVKYISSFVSLIHGVDSLKLLKVINKEAIKHNRSIDFLFEIHIANEETKFGLNYDGLSQILNSSEFKELKNVNLRGLMGMASYTDNKDIILNEFKQLSKYFHSIKNSKLFAFNNFNVLSMGMSGDYKLAIEAGSTMVRIGSSIFGAR